MMFPIKVYVPGQSLPVRSFQTGLLNVEDKKLRKEVDFQIFKSFLKHISWREFDILETKEVGF